MPECACFAQRLTAILFATVLLLCSGGVGEAGCGCNKPPPAPAAVIPNVAFAGMRITLFHDSFQEGQRWKVVFYNGAKKKILPRVPVVLKRDLSDPSGLTVTPQLVLSLPDIPQGPTSIVASRKKDVLSVPETSFTVIGKPVMVSEQNISYTVNNYSTAVGADRTLYFSVGGLAAVCKPMKFQALIDGYPLRFTYGDVVVSNSQGFLIEPLTLRAANHFFPKPKNDPEESDRMDYWRHSFAQYCADHLPGGPKVVDPQDPNWHLDGTPHVDYSTLIFAIAGHFDDNSLSTPGGISFKLEVESEISEVKEPWEREKEEEDVTHR